MPRSTAAVTYNVWRESHSQPAFFVLERRVQGLRRAKSLASYFSVSAPPVQAVVSCPDGCVSRYYDGSPLKSSAPARIGMKPFPRFNDRELKAFTKRAHGSFSFLQDGHEDGQDGLEQLTMLRCEDAFGDPCWLCKVAIYPLVNMDERLRRFTFEWSSFWPH
jgi:hypothetical protein